MNKLRAVFKWKRKNYDSDSTGYCSSSDVSSRPPLSDSQFILRPAAIVGPSYSFYTAHVDYSPSSSSYTKHSNTVSSRTSRTSANSHNTTSTSSRAYKADESSLDDDDVSRSTLRPSSSQTLRDVPMLPRLTSIQHFMAQVQEDTINSEQSSRTTTEDDVVVATSSSSSSSYVMSAFPFDGDDDEMADLFDQLEVDDQEPSTSSYSGDVSTSTSTLRRKKLLIQEPISKIYYDDDLTSEADYDDSEPHQRPRAPLQRIETILQPICTPPRSILKKGPSFAGHIYEEIDGDHLNPLPDDIRPKLPHRSYLQALHSYVPCSVFSPKLRYPSIRRKKKLPSLHHSHSVASYFLNRKRR